MQATDRTLIPIMSHKQRLVFFCLVAVWIVALAWFLLWWFERGHVVTTVGFVLTSVVLFWELLLPGYFFFFVGRMRKTNPSLALPSGRIAMVVTKAPSEPFAIVQKTLIACLSQTPTHDTWLADEDPTPEVYTWCANNGVEVCTRKGIAEYHQPTWPRRTKCKEGNLAYFYDTIGYDKYDIVVQLDADHVPAQGYLAAMVRPFADKKVGYVSAPSICDANAAESWAARGRLYAEAIMHGALQAGHTNTFAPLCIGSHYAVRTKALKEIGGLGPELAEDHSTTLMFNAAGWKGVHALDAEAHGDGPATFPDCMVQEYQWSRSLMVVFLTLTPKLLWKLPLRQKIEFIFAQLWYPMFAAIMLLGTLLPLLAILLGQPLVQASYLSYLIHGIPLHALVLGIVWFLKQGGWLRPASAKVISWEGILFHMVRWPWVIWGVLSAMYVVVTKKNVQFKVTPKGEHAVPTLPVKVLAPYIAIIVFYIVTLALVPTQRIVAGYYFFCVLTILSYGVSLIAILLLHMRSVNRHEVKMRSFRASLEG